MNRTISITYIILSGVIIYFIYLFFQVPRANELFKFELVECDISEREEFTTLFLQQNAEFTNGQLNLPEQEYLAHFNYCSLDWMERDLIYLRDSMGFGDDVKDSYFDIHTKVNFKNYTIDSLSFNAISIFNAIVMGERSLIYAEQSKENRYFFKAMGRFWLNSSAEKLTEICLNNPKLKYDINFKMLVDRCRQNQYNVAIKYASSEKIVNYLINKEYTYIFNRVWYNTSVITKGLIILLLTFTMYSYYILTLRFYSIFKNKQLWKK